jgi:hypothetical protein
MGTPITEAADSSRHSRNSRGPRWLDMVFKVVGAVGCLVPLAVLAQLIHRYGVNLPFSDQWDLVSLIEKARTSGLEFSDLYNQHGEQRMVFPRMVMLALAPVTRWNTKVELWVNLILAAGMFCILLILVLRSLSPLGRWRVVPAVALSLMVFSPVQWEDWFWGWQISWFLPLLCFLVAVGVLTLWPDRRPAWPALAIATIAALVGQYSLFSGTLIWIICLPVVLIRDKFRRHWWIWVLIAAVSTSAYLYRYTNPAAMASFRAPIPEILQEPKRPAAYILYYLGRPVLDAEPSYLVGALFAGAFVASAAYVLIRRRSRLALAMVWISIGAYALLSSVATMLTRLGLGLQFAGSSRYTTIGILLMVATTALVSLALLPDAGQAPAPAASLAVASWLLVAGLFLLDYRSEVESMRLWHGQRLAQKDCVITATSERDPCLTAVHPVPDRVYRGAQFLKRVGWAGLRDRPREATSGADAR